MTKKAQFHFPRDIKLSNAPLIEAWLEIRWKLKEVANQLLKDTAYAFALGKFYEHVKADFGFTENLPANEMPEELLPYIVRHRFRKEQGTWPVLQIGPGIATLNLVADYSWQKFKAKAMYLIEAINYAYEGSDLVSEAVALRYRNSEMFDFETENVIELLSGKFNTIVNFPKYLPGSLGSKGFPKTFGMNVSFDLKKPQGVGVFAFNTGTRAADVIGNQPPQTEKHVFWDLSVISQSHSAPNIQNTKKLDKWLEEAHAIIHEWFLALAEGMLLDRYK